MQYKKLRNFKIETREKKTDSKRLAKFYTS